MEWDPRAPVTVMGQLVFFSQFLATGRLLSQWVGEAEYLALWRGTPLVRQAFFEAIESQVPRKQVFMPDAHLSAIPWCSHQGQNQSTQAPILPTGH